MGPANLFSYWAIALYRMTLAYFVGGNCRFVPSCSVYAQQALRAKTFVPAWLLIGRRLSKCHPWHPGGPDPVPK